MRRLLKNRNKRVGFVRERSDAVHPQFNVPSLLPSLLPSPGRRKEGAREILSGARESESCSCDIFNKARNRIFIRAQLFFIMIIVLSTSEGHEAHSPPRKRGLFSDYSI